MNRKSLVRILAVAFYLSCTAVMTLAQMQDSHVSMVTGEQTATLLPNGKLLLVGGRGPAGQPVGDITLRDPQGQEEHLPASLKFPRSAHTATVLPDGTVLVLGGVGSDGLVVGEAEIFDPRSGSVQPLTFTAPRPRTFHSATLLTDGRVLIAGGVESSGTVSGTAELWDPRQKNSSSIPLRAPRRSHASTLWPDGRVLLSGGKDANGNASPTDEVFDPQSLTFSPVSAVRPLPASNTAITEAAATSPEDGASDVPLTALLSMRFSRPLQMQSINDQTILLSGPFGIVDAKIVGAESGMLAFITPQAPLLPGTAYTVRFSGAVDARNISVAFTQFTFTTVGDAPQGDLWVPTADWMFHNGTSKWQSLSPLQASPGVVALAGQVLKLDGTPLAHVTLRIGGHKAESDETGRFLMTGIPAGHSTMMILADTANTPARKYGVYEVGVDIQPGVTNVLAYTIWMTALDTAHAVRIPSPTASETIVTSPLLPGLELHLPANTVITDSKGKVVTEITITPIPLDKPPFPLPHVPVPIYFTIQPGAAYIKVMNSSGPKGARLFYPNAHGYPPATPFQFWNYNPATPKGWFIYGNGKVSQDRSQIVPDPGVEIYEFTGAMVANPGNAPPVGSKPGNDSQGGEPVDLGTGLFIYKKADLVLPDVIPIVLTRIYRQNDPVSRSFGVGASQPYDIFMIGDNNTFPEGYTFQDLILPDGGRIHFQRTSPCTGANGYCDFGNAVYQHTSSATDFNGAVLKFQSCSPSGSWTLTKKDGTIYCFPDSDASNNPRSAAPSGMHDRYGNALIFTRDSNHNLTQITSPNGRWIQFTYDAGNRIIQAKDIIGRTVNYSYDSGGRLTSVVDANGGVWNYAYDAFNQMTSIQDPRGTFYLTNQYDQNGRVIQQTQADNTHFLFSYVTDPGTGNIIQTDVTNPLGITKRTTYDATGYKISEAFALGRPEQQTITYNRDPNTALVSSRIDGLSRQTSYTHDSFGNVTSITRLAGTQNAVTTSFTLEPAYHQLATMTDPLNHTTTVAYNSSGAVSSITDPLGHQTALAYNGQGLLLSITDPLGNATQFSYDGGDLVAITDALGNTSKRFIDGAGRLLAVTDPLGRITHYSYNPSDQVVQNTDPLQGITSFSYDPNGNMVSMTNPRGYTTSWTYNNMDHVATRTDPLLRTESYTYDQAGKVITFTDRKGQATTYNYDGLNRRTFVGFGTQGSGSNTTYSSTIAFQYDAANRMTQAVDSLAGTITHGYDNLDHLTSEATPQGSISYGYDAAGRRTSMAVSGQPSASYSYDDADRLVQIAQGVSIVSFSYDDANRRISMVLSNGISISYGYDNGSQLTGITYNFGGSALGNLTYAYDALGQRTEMGGSFSRTSLPQSLAASYDAANELTNWNGIGMSYDANGNLSSDGANSFTWNARDQLVTLNGNTLQYDAFGRRIQSSANRSFLYDGGNVVQELSGPSVTANLLSGGVDEMFTRSDSSGSSTLLRDALGSTLALVDASGNVQTTYTYDPFGATTVAGQASTNEFQYTGREDEGSGIYYYRARYYSPLMGRFISEDPMGFSGGLNVYAYAGNSPISHYDPSGFDPIPAPPGPPPIPVPGGGPDNGWKWNPNPQNSRGGSWGPQQPIPGQSQPSGSWDPEGHWDVDNGLGDRQRYDPDGKPLTPDQAHGKCDKNPGPQPESPTAPDPNFIDKMSQITGLTGTALIIYLIVSEGTRLFPPRNLVPVP